VFDAAGLGTAFDIAYDTVLPPRPCGCPKLGAPHALMRVGAENSVTSCNSEILVYQATEASSDFRADDQRCDAFARRFLGKKSTARGATVDGTFVGGQGAITP
jgi:hypothetical protein